jgi:co-chaperonin GroES (HSP10)
MTLNQLKMKNQKITPVGRKILVKKKEAEKYFPGTSILIPEGTGKKECKAIVVAVGNTVELIEPGQVIQYADYAKPTIMMHDGEEHFLLNAEDVFAIINV